MQPQPYFDLIIRGGGDAKLAQGGGAASEAQFQLFSARTDEFFRALRK